MTSANRSSEPIAYEDRDAIERLSGIADSFLIGQRPIARRVDALLSGETTAGEPSVPELSSPAVDEWKVAQAYVRRADPESLASALEHLREAERLDPTFAPAPELAGSIFEMRGELSLAEKAYERGIAADPARAGTYERLAFLLARQPGREADAEEAWRRAEQAGSSEALHALAVSAERKGRRSEAQALYQRYLAESPGGVHSEEDSRSVARLVSARRTNFGAMAAAAAALLLAAAVVGYRRFGGSTFEEWIRARPERAREARPIVGRLRHEVVKHGGLLLSDAAKRLSEPDPGARRRTAELLRSRLFGASDARGLLAESADAFERLRSLAKQDGVRLNLERKDLRFSPIAKGSRILRGLQKSLDRIAEEDDAGTRRVTTDLERAAALLRSASGAGISRVLDEASSTRASSGRAAARSLELGGERVRLRERKDTGEDWKEYETRYRPNPTLERALDILFILHADHEQNASTSTVRLVGSTGANPYALLQVAVVGAVIAPVGSLREARATGRPYRSDEPLIRRMAAAVAMAAAVSPTSSTTTRSSGVAACARKCCRRTF